MAKSKSKAKLMPLYEQVARLVECEIETGKYKAGDRIYSIRELCEQFDVSDVTAKKALAQLSKRGLVNSITGSGIFVSERETHGTQRQITRNVVGFLKLGGQSASVFQLAVDFIQQELQLRGYPLMYSAAMNPAEADASIQHLVACDAGCLLVFPTHGEGMKIDDLRSPLRASNLPVLVFESRTETDSYIATDIERTTVELADYLYELGHRHICLASAFSRKINGLKHAADRWKDPSVKLTVLDAYDYRTDVSSVEAAREIAAMKPRPTAVISNNDRTAAIEVETFIGLGLNVPDDVSVATFDDHPAYLDLSPVAMTTMRHPAREIATETARWAKTQLTTTTGRRARRWRRELTGSLIVRDSTAPPANG